MEGLGRSMRTGVAIAAMASAFITSGSFAAGGEPDLSGIWWATSYSPKLLAVDGGDPPLNAAGKAQYEKNKAGLKDGSLVDKGRF